MTRARHEGSDHDQVMLDHWAQLVNDHQLAWQWQAHGFRYGIGAHYADMIAAGNTVVVNGSREHCMALQASPRIKIVQITTDAQTLVERLTQRGRDTTHEVNQRLPEMQSLRIGTPI